MQNNDSSDANPRRARSPSDAPRRLLQTGEAARYLGVSASLLRKMRLRGPEDPSGSGPKFIRLSPQLVVYDITELDRWVDAHASKTRRAAAA